MHQESSSENSTSTQGVTFKRYSIRNRRQAVIAVAAVVAGAFAASTAQSVAATDGQPLVVGVSNDSTRQTSIVSSAVAAFSATTTFPPQIGSLAFGLYGEATQRGGVGVQGVASEGTGVIGNIKVGNYASAPIGVQGFNQANTIGATGVQGYITGAAASTFGMEGINGGAGNYRTGVQGTINATNAVDILSAGVRGLNLATGTLTLGVYGQADAAAGTGVYGQSQNGVGVKGVGFNNVGVYGVNGGGSAPFGVVGTVTTAPGFALYGVTSVPGTVGFAAGGINGAIAGQFSGPVNVFGQITLQAQAGTAGGNAFVVGPGVTKNAAVQVADGSHRLMHCVEAPEPWFEDFGEGTISAGRAEVQLDSIFASTVDMSKLHVFFTEHKEHHALHLTGRSKTGFTLAADVATLAIKGKKAADVNGTFTWRVVAKRKDVKGDRLAHFELPKEIKLAPPPLPEEIKFPMVPKTPPISMPKKG